ncbi:hypothetical protein, partial [Caballeronia arvi]|uniref:hypothetical protein n=1 Tax=Caballeronia arvi TaxID=1777135 RepID=UPI001F18B94F
AKAAIVSQVGQFYVGDRVSFTSALTRRRNELENNLPPKAKMDLQKEMLRLCDANNGWTRDLLGRDRERLKHELERAGPDVALTLPLLTTLHEAHEAMQAYRRHLLDTIERIKRGAL